MSELNNIVIKILGSGKGILAADESTGTMTKRLEAVNVESTQENRLLFRETLFSSESMKKCIGGVILYDETIKQNSKSKSNTNMTQLLIAREALTTCMRPHTYKSVVGCSFIGTLK